MNFYKHFREQTNALTIAFPDKLLPRIVHIPSFDPEVLVILCTCYLLLYSIKVVNFASETLDG